MRNEHAAYPTTLLIYLTGQQRDFIDDRPNAGPDELYERFLAWFH